MDANGKGEWRDEHLPDEDLLATDGSEEAELAAARAVELSKEPTPSCTWCTSEWYPSSCELSRDATATTASSTSRSKRSPQSCSEAVWRVKAPAEPWPEPTSGWGRWTWRSWPWPRR
jgi:hypothetical protein